MFAYIWGKWGWSVYFKNIFKRKEWSSGYNWSDLTAAVVIQKNRSQRPQAEFPSDSAMNLRLNLVSGTASAFASSTLSK